MNRPVTIRLALLALVAALAAPATARTETVSFETEDGFTIVGDLHAGAPEAGAAILLHMYRTDRTAWAPLVPKLRAAGWTVLAIDQRTHGDSTRRGGETVRVADIRWRDYGPWVRDGVADVAAARALLAGRGLGGGRLALVGASYGCSVALLAAEAQGGVDALVLLAPGLRYFGVPVKPAAEAFAGPMLLVGAEDDARRDRDAEALARAHSGHEKLVVYSSGGHGTDLFASRPAVLGTIADFLGPADAP